MKFRLDKLDSLATDIHQSNVDVGWWDDYPVMLDRLPTAMMLVISEVAEALEGDRKDLMDSHIPEWKAFDMELADVAIRILDLIGAYRDYPIGDIRNAVESEIQFLSVNTVPEQLFQLCKSCYEVTTTNVEHNIAWCLITTIAIAELNNVNLEEAIDLKRAYNAKRLDHKKATRQAKGGKKY